MFVGDSADTSARKFPFMSIFNVRRPGSKDLGWISFQKSSCGFTATILSNSTILEWKYKQLLKFLANLGVRQASSKWGQNRREMAIIALTNCFYHLHIFLNRFPCWSVLLLYFGKDAHEDHMYGHIKTCHNRHYGHFRIFAVIAHLNIAINMVFIGVNSKCITNAVKHQKPFLKICKL